MKRQLMLAILCLTVITMIPTKGTRAGVYLKLYYTTDDGKKDQMPTEANDDPLNQWEEVDENGELTISLDEGETFWIACRNVTDNDNTKGFAVKYRVLAPDHILAGNLGVAVDGLREADADRFSNVRHLRSEAPDDNKSRTIHELLWPQPMWERLTIRNDTHSRIDGLRLRLQAWSCCSDIDRSDPDVDWPTFPTFNNTTYGAPGAGTDDDSKVREVWVFPKSAQVYTGASPVFTAPSATGQWTSAFIYQDPYGTERPSGGVRWVTDGAGLGPEDVHDFGFGTVDFSDQEFDLYAIIDGDTLDIALVAPDALPPIPTLTEWGFFIFGVLLLASVVFYIYRRRRLETA